MFTLYNRHPVTIPTPSNIEALAIATILKDMGATNLTAFQLNADAYVMTQAQLNVGYAALLNPSMTAGEVKLEVTMLTLYPASTAFGNAAIPIPSLRDDASVLNNRVSSELTNELSTRKGTVEALAIATSLHDMGDSHVTAAQVTEIAAVMSQAQLDVAYAALLNPAMTRGEVEVETVMLTLYPASTTFGNASIAIPTHFDAANAISLIGYHGVFA